VNKEVVFFCVSVTCQLNCLYVDRVPYLCLAKTFEAIEKVSAR